MKFDFTITLSIVIIFVTAISPIIVTIINNKHQIELKKLDNDLNIRNKVINDFIDITLNCNNKNFNISEFYKLYVKVSAYSIDSHSKTVLSTIHDLIEQDAEYYYSQIVNALKDFIEILNMPEPTKPSKQKLTKNKLSKLLKH